MRGLELGVGLSWMVMLAPGCVDGGAGTEDAGGAPTKNEMNVAGDRGAGLGGVSATGGSSVAFAGGAGIGGAGAGAGIGGADTGIGGAGAGAEPANAGAGGTIESPTACPALPEVATPVFEVLGDLAPGVERPSGGYETVPEALSLNGNAIAGASSTQGDQGHAYVWTSAAGMKDLRTGANGLADAVATNCDASIVYVTDDRGSTLRLAGGGPPLELLPGTPGGVDVWVRAVDASGQVAVGATGGDADASAERWVGATAKGMPLGVHGYATDVSADGTVIAGVRYVGAQVAAIFRWTAAEGAVDLAPATGRLAQVSADGTSVIALHPNDLPFRWRKDGITELSCGAGHGSCTPELINHDGSVIILSGPAPDYEQMVWSDGKGTVAFNAAVIAAGASLGSWTSLNVVDMSADARVFTGMAFGANDASATYRLQVPAGTF